MEIVASHLVEKNIFWQHRSICKSIQLKCLRCHWHLRDVVSLSQHMRLCLVPTCAICQEQFVELDRLREHMKSHNKRKAVSSSHPIGKRKEKMAESCAIVMFVYNTSPIEKDSFTTWLIQGLTTRWNILTLKMKEWMHCYVKMLTSFLLVIALLK